MAIAAKFCWDSCLRGSTGIQPPLTQQQGYVFQKAVLMLMIHTRACITAAHLKGRYKLGMDYTHCATKSHLCLACKVCKQIIVEGCCWEDWKDFMGLFRLIALQSEDCELHAGTAVAASVLLKTPHCATSSQPSDGHVKKKINRRWLAAVCYYVLANPGQVQLTLIQMLFAVSC